MLGHQPKGEAQITSKLDHFFAGVLCAAEGRQLHLQGPQNTPSHDLCPFSLGTRKLIHASSYDSMSLAPGNGG